MMDKSGELGLPCVGEPCGVVVVDRDKVATVYAII